MEKFDTYARIGLLFRKHFVTEDRIGRGAAYPWYSWMLCMAPASVVGYVFVKRFALQFRSRPDEFDMMTEWMLSIAAREVESHDISLEDAEAFWAGVRAKIFGDAAGMRQEKSV